MQARVVHPLTFYARTMSDSIANPGTPGERVGDQLKALFAEVVGADLAPEEKGRWHKRLIAITNTSKHDVERAGNQLARFVEEWNALQRGKGMSKNAGGR